MINKEIYITKLKKITGLDISEIYIGPYTELLSLVYEENNLDLNDMHNICIEITIGKSFYFSDYCLYNLGIKMNSIILSLLCSNQKHKIILGLNLL
jgi:hypothetical protein